MGLNHRPTGYGAVILPTELLRQMVAQGGLEPPTRRL